MLELVRLSPLRGFLLGCAVLYALLIGSLVYRDRTSPVERTILGLCGFAAPVVLFLCAILVLGVNVPYWDDYDVFLPYLSMPAAERMRHLFDFHNEHRILTTRLAAELVRAWNGAFSFKGCMLAGNSLLLLLAVLLFTRFRRQGRSAFLLFLPCLWLLLDLLNHQNMLWALTSVQSHSVLLFALLALLCLERGNAWPWLLASLASALLCTFSSGGGVLIWPCLVGLVVVRHLQAGRPGTAAEAPPASRMLPKAIAFATVATVSIGGFFHGFGQRTGASSAETLLGQPFAVLDFFATFCGGAAPFRYPALVLGCLIVGSSCLLIVRFRSVRDLPMLFFLVFLLGTAAAAAAFRSQDGIQNALSHRYRVVAVSIFASALLLAREQIRLPRRWAKGLCAGMAAGAVLLNLGVCLFSWDLQRERAEKLVHNLLLWPATDAGLRYPDTAKASRTLQRACDVGVYCPDILRRKGRPEPVEFIPW